MEHIVFLPRSTERLAELYWHEVLDTASEKAFDDLVHLAASLYHAPIVVISPIGSERQWFKLKVGLPAPQTSRGMAFWIDTILDDECFVAPDAREGKHFAENSLDIGDPHLRFYCGAPRFLRPSLLPCRVPSADREIHPDK